LVVGQLAGIETAPLDGLSRGLDTALVVGAAAVLIRSGTGDRVPAGRRRRAGRGR
jgi:hypothetical protein